MSWMRMMLPPRRMTPPMRNPSVPTGPGIPAGVSTPDADFFDGVDLPQIDYSKLDNNVFMPNSVFGSSRIARGLDNALLSAATFQPGQTTGENISAVAKNLLGLEPEREQMNLSRQMSPYLSMEPLLKMKSEMSDMDYRKAMSEHARAMADYYRNGGKDTKPEVKQDAQGRYFQVDSAGNATPITQKDTTQYQMPDMQLGRTTIPGGQQSVSGPVQLTGHVANSSGSTLIERQLDAEDEERVANGQLPRTASERSNRVMEFYNAQAGAQTGGRISSTPGYMSEADKERFKSEMDPVNTELDRLTKMSATDRIVENAMSPQNPVEQRIKNLTDQRNQIMQRYIPRGGSGSPMPQTGGLPEIPAPVAPVAGPGMRPVNIGGIPGMASPGATDAMIAQATAKAAPSMSKPSPSKSRSGRPSVKIHPDGTISVE